MSTWKAFPIKCKVLNLVFNAYQKFLSASSHTLSSSSSLLKWMNHAWFWIFRISFHSHFIYECFGYIWIKMEHFHLNRDNYVLPLVWIKYERKFFIWILVKLFISEGSINVLALKIFHFVVCKTKTCKYYFIYITTSQCLQCCLESLNCYVLWVLSMKTFALNNSSE